MNFDFFMPAKVLFGAGRLNELAKVPLPGKKALIVLTAGKSMKQSGTLDRVVSLLGQNGVQSVIFDRILPNPVLRHVTEGAALARAEGCDFVVGLGGGSSIDSAKAIAVMAKNPGNYWDYIGSGSGGKMKVEHGALPIVAITTTAGTGTEADPWTVITKDGATEKIGFGIAETFPTLSIVDPELMTTVPAKLTAFQGFDALFHATEGFMANIATPVSDLFALKSIELIFKHLPTAVAQGTNIEARTGVAYANTLSGIVESTSGCTSEHSIEHAMSAHHPELPHGAGLIMISQAYHAHFARKIPERFREMAKAAGAKQTDDPMAFVRALADLAAACGVGDLKMSDYGITRAELPALAKNAVYTMGGLFSRDCELLSPDDTVKILEKSYK